MAPASRFLAPKTLLKLTKKWGIFIIIIAGIYLSPALTWVPYMLQDYEFLGPWLTWNDDPRTTIVVNWWTSTASKGYVLYWNSTFKKFIYSNESAEIHHIKLTGLSPESKYFYVVGVVEGSSFKNLTRVYSFKTAPKNSTDFSFLVICDEQYHVPVLGSTEMSLKAVREEKADYDFIISLGDHVDSDRLIVAWKRFFYNLGDLAANKTFMPTIGNHEMIEWGSNRAENYLKFFNLPGNKTYYFFEYSNAVFITVNFYDYENLTITPQEEEFLKEVIPEYKSKGYWVFLYYHVPTVSAFSSDFFPLGESKLNPNAMKFLRLLGELRPDVVFTGHVHGYGRVTINGTVFLTLGSTGGVPEPMVENTEEWHGYKVEAWNFEYGYMLVSVSGDSAHFIYKSIFGEVLDEFTLER